jgi:two-component system, cell cycle response regulator
MEEEGRGNVNVLILCEREYEQDQFQALFNISGLKTDLQRNAGAFYARLERESPEVILLAANAPYERVLEHVAKLRQPGSVYRDIPVVVVFPEGTPKEVTLSSLYEGAYDYLIEPFNEIELLTKITVLAKIKHAEDEFRRLAIRDVLTGLYDRRYLNLRLEEEMSRSRRYSKPISCIAIDLDGFGAVNEKFGSDAGDLVLQGVADELKRRKREIDVLARKEDDEFVLVLYNTDLTGATILAGRILDHLAQLEFSFDAMFRVSASLGLSSMETSPEAPVHGQELLHQAELALKHAQAEGGARVVVYSAELA